MTNLVREAILNALPRRSHVDCDACEIYAQLCFAAWDTGATPRDVAKSLQQHIAAHPSLIPEILELERMGDTWVNARGESNPDTSARG